jgi:hypothetical protein
MHSARLLFFACSCAFFPRLHPEITFDFVRIPHLIMILEESLKTNVYLAIESQRAHLVGPGRRGNIEFKEDKERYTFRFDPCGTGGGILVGYPTEGTPPRTEAPYGWG